MGRCNCNRLGDLGVLVVEVDLAPLGPLELLRAPQRGVDGFRMLRKHASIMMSALLNGSKLRRLPATALIGRHIGQAGAGTTLFVVDGHLVVPAL
jgi:hypothetical protein